MTGQRMVQSTFRVLDKTIRSKGQILCPGYNTIAWIAYFRATFAVQCMLDV